MRILGISAYYHDSAAALIEDGIPIAIAQEERFSRVKHDSRFPEKAIDFCLSKTGNRTVDYVVFYEKPFIKFERFIISAVSFFPHSTGIFRQGMLSWLKQKMWIKGKIAEYFNIEDNKIFFVPHHLSHAAASFLCSPFDESAILTVDGVGEWTTTALGIGRGTEISLTKEICFPHSLGLLYSVFTGYLGFRVNDGEYKLMGLAPYGKPTYMSQINQLIDVKDDGSFRLNLKYFAYHKSTELPYNKKFIDLFGNPRDPTMGHQFDQRHADIAASIQTATEQVIIKLVNNLFNETGIDKLCISGGVGLNSVANYKILQKTPIKNIYIQPAAGDAGAALGAALYVYYHLFENKRKFIMEHAYYGSDFSKDQIKSFLASKNLNYQEYSNNELTDYVAEGIDKGKIYGWFQGAAEWGPRALGNRSILADARRKEMLKTVNMSVKFRESFRPFAPSVLYEDSDYLFDLQKDHYPSRFMLYVCPVKNEIIDKKLLPAITHVDGSARPQVVMKSLNPLYYDLLEKFKERSGIGCFLNTSFNLSGEPIVNSPENAYQSFIESRIDELVLGNFVIGRPEM